jgi:2-polyprenyl-6-methoxyphenol hydroxylase-like FAD-dependent oxidoreductase
MSTSSQPISIAIIGAGLGGLSLALFLTRLQRSDSSHAHPFSITILESRPATAESGGYLALAPNALHVLHQLGLYSQVLERGFAYEDITFYSARNLSWIGAVRNGDRVRYGFPCVRVARSFVRGVLLERAREVGVEVRFGVKVLGVGEDGKGGGVEGMGKVRVEVEEGAVERFDFVVGADGIHSRVRASLSAVQPTFSGLVGIGGGRVKREEISEELVLPAMILGKMNSFMMMPTVADGSVVSCFATMETEERSREGWAMLGADHEKLKAMLVERHCDVERESWPEIVRRTCRQSEAESLTIWPFYNAPVLESWTSQSGRVLVLGDAAHAMPPTGGQGAAMAFEDAASLAVAFKEILVSEKPTDDCVSIFQGWQTRRQERVRKVKVFTEKGGDIRRATPSLAQQIVKEWAMWAFFQVRGKDMGMSWLFSHEEDGPVEG